MSESSPRRPPGWVKTFSDRYPWIGPTIWMLSILYFVAQVVVGLAWKPHYSILNNTISDLGLTTCGPYDGRYMCSPRHGIMNASFILLGVIMASGSLLIRQEFTDGTPQQRIASYIGFTCLAVGGLGAILVGTFPENTVKVLHLTGAGLAIGVSNVGIAILGWILVLPAWLRWYMRVLSITSVLALILFLTHGYLGVGAGGMERIAGYPETVWLIVFGVYISWNHYANRLRGALGRLRVAEPAASQEWSRVR